MSVTVGDHASGMALDGIALDDMAPAGEDFARLADPLRGELLAHCYRMLGSVHDAEDQVQETMMRAWQARGNFEGRSSLRTWLYRIATNSCLRAMENRSRRPLPSGLAGPGQDPEGPVGAIMPEISWLQPIPDTLVAAESADPASIAVSRSSLRLALIAALQYLPARQRAVLILRDVLGWRASEVAELLGASTIAVNSMLQRARAQLERVSAAEDEVREPADPDQRALLGRYAAAFEQADITSLTGLLRADAVLEMPPIPTWFRGREMIGRFLAARFGEPDQFRMIRTAANGQPAVASYLRGRDGGHHAHAVQVLTFRGPRIARIVSFNDPALITLFGLPPSFPAAVPLAPAPARRPAQGAWPG